MSTDQMAYATDWRNEQMKTYPMDDLMQEPMAWMSPGKERLEFSRKDTVYGSHTVPLYTAEQMREYAKQAVEAELEVILDELSGCIQGDLEHGVKCLNEKAAKDFQKNYPELSKFWGWLSARSQA